MPKIEQMPLHNERRERIAAARAQISNATAQLEAALANVTGTGINNPILSELQQTIVAGRRMIARSTEILKRIP